MRFLHFAIFFLSFEVITCLEYNEAVNAISSRKRLLYVTRNIVDDAKRVAVSDRRIFGIYAKSPQFEIGYLFSQVMDKYRMMVERARAMRKVEWPIFHTLYLLQNQQRTWFEVLHLTNMIHEIPRKYGYKAEFYKLLLQSEKDVDVGNFEEEMKKKKRQLEKEIRYLELSKIVGAAAHRMEMFKTKADVVKAMEELRSRIPSYGGIGDASELKGQMIKLKLEKLIQAWAAKYHEAGMDPHAVTKPFTIVPWLALTKVPRDPPPGAKYIGKPKMPFGPGGQPAYKGGRKPKVFTWDYGWEPDYEWWVATRAG